MILIIQVKIWVTITKTYDKRWVDDEKSDQTLTTHISLVTDECKWKRLKKEVTYKQPYKMEWVKIDCVVSY